MGLTTRTIPKSTTRKTTTSTSTTTTIFFELPYASEWLSRRGRYGRLLRSSICISGSLLFSLDINVHASSAHTTNVLPRHVRLLLMASITTFDPWSIDSASKGNTIYNSIIKVFRLYILSQCAHALTALPRSLEKH